jgi:hypothetical protein
MFIDNSGSAYTFNIDEGPYGLATESEVWRQEMIKRYGQWSIPSFDVGTNFVPNDMLANIHKGERIVPAADNARLMTNGDNIYLVLSEVKNEVRMLREERKIDAAANVRASKLTARLMEKWDIDGLPEERAA